MKTIRTIALILDTLLRTVVVAGVVFTFAWLLVTWAARRPVVVAGDDGAIRLSAEAATTQGPPEIRFNTYAGKKNIGWWDFDNQWLEWKVDVERAGSYRVELEYARPGSEEVGLELSVGEAALMLPVAGTGGWDQWRTVELGEIELAVGDGQTVSLKVVNLPSEGVINLVGLDLLPR